MAIEAEVVRRLDPVAGLAVHVGKAAWEDAAMHAVDPQRVGVILGNIVLPTSANAAMSDWVFGRKFERELFRAAGLPGPAEDRAAVPAANRWAASLPAAILARALGLGAGHFTLDAACASSLYALELAVDHLRAGRADAMLAGGLARPDSLYTQMGFSQLRALSPTGRCSPFDKKGDGLVVGEGAGILVLKRLSDALDHGDQIRAVVKGVGLSNDVDGNLLAPSEEGQLRAMRAAYAQAGWRPSDVELIECHATGTPVGDAVEFASLRQLWGDEQGRAVIGSAKSNVGHLLTGAGAVGLIKSVLAMEHGRLPPTANFEAPSSKIELGPSPFEVLARAEDWNPRGETRRAAVSGFGFGGTNAHVLLEQAREPRRFLVDVPDAVARPDVAVVGMAAQVGPWRDLVSLQRRLLGAGQAHAPSVSGADSGFGTPPGWFIDALEVPLGRFRIPPKELADALPQQSLMLDVARQALDDLRSASSDRLRTGVFLGLELDLNTTNYALRWSIRARAPAWARELGRESEGPQFQAWVDALCDWVSAALDANRTMGGLASIAASRIAREFGLGGPSYVSASHEVSGLVALQSAASALQRGQLDQALVGAVDLCGDVRSLIATDADLGLSPNGQVLAFDRRAAGTVSSDAAVCLVLKRLEDAERDGDRVYAVLERVATASGTTERALRNAVAEVRREVLPRGELPLLELSGTGVASRDGVEARVLGEALAPGAVVTTSTPAVGHAGAASGLLSVLKASVCLYQQLLPGGHRPAHPRTGLARFTLLEQSEPWVRNRADGPRRAGVSALSNHGAGFVVLSESEQGAIASERSQPAGPPADALFVIEADDEAAITVRLARLADIARDAAMGIDALARAFHGDQGRKPEARLCLSLVASDRMELGELADAARHALERGEDPEHVRAGKVFFRAEPLGAAAKLAFVYPGSGAQFPGMGRAAALAWPELLRSQDAGTQRLADQLLPTEVWRADADVHDPRTVILSQVALGTLATDLMTSFGLRPAAVIGYSLGETAGLFSLGVWQERDEMLRRVGETDLFSDVLAGPCTAARQTWGLQDGERAHWKIGVIDRPAAVVRERVQAHPRAYLLIINTPGECVIGGDANAVDAVVDELGAGFHELRGITTVHCEVARRVEQAYRELHLLDTRAPADVRFYSGNLGRAYDVDRASAAESLVSQALDGVDFPKTITRAYEDGVRIFLELGPGSSCARMVSQILDGRRFFSRSLSSAGQDGRRAVLRTLGALLAERVPVTLDALYPPRREPEASAQGRSLHIPVGRRDFGPLPLSPQGDAIETHSPSSASTGAQTPSTAPTSLFSAAVAAAESTARAHEAYLRLANQVHEVATQQAFLTGQLLRAGAVPDVVPQKAAPPQAGTLEPQVAFDREQCLEFAIGSVGKMLGQQFAQADVFPTRVRLPDEPLMLVDRILAVEGQPLSMTSGRVVTEHDVLHDGWYLDGGRIPTCIAVEAGQADLFLSGYLGADFETRGLAMYRLLDAEVTFHDELPTAGRVIHYDIRIKEFFRQGETLLFRFEFDGTVDGRALLTMRDGCAGFFSQAELDAGKGIVRSRLEQREVPGQRPDDWTELVPMRRESLSPAQLESLRAGDLVAAFGDAFLGLAIDRPLTIPDGRMKLVHRVTRIEPSGGRFGLGLIRAEADIDPQDWFLTCHFVDDQVMPGTLMYECCLHTLRVFLLRMGWVASADDACWQPIPGVKSRLKCRGQVLDSTRTVTYEISIRELGYDPEPYAICEALMYADGKPIVDITGMCVRLTGTDRARIEALWAGRGEAAAGPAPKPAVYDNASIVAFGGGKPSEAFGQPYEVFDEARRIARLPRAPYQFLDRITQVRGAPFVMEAGAFAEAQFEVSPDHWYFDSNRQDDVPFAVLLEAALQPCGWISAYVGSALTSQTDLRYRNLGGEATLLGPVDRRPDVITTRAWLERVSHSAGMIIQNFRFECFSQTRGKVYAGTTYFGFFSDEALAAQVGIRGAQLPEVRGRAFAVPADAPYPDDQMRMVALVDGLSLEGGPAGLGSVAGSIGVDPQAWFFQAHFFQDPVWPGSLGLEAFLQLLKVYAGQRWKLGPDAAFATMPLQKPHKWSYRGQIIPSCQRVDVFASITAVDESRRRVVADGYVSVDGKPIYELNDFGLEVRR
jgi:acyl transferase domain-containing protein/3-hydroxymyristoyl/3-hydroxydecanoyl-(acyl carrier protein) dehydratase